MNIQKIPIEKIEFLKDNPRFMLEKDLNELAKNISRYGYNQPIVVWDKGDGSYVVIKGNQRLKALKKLGYEEVECIVVNYANEDEAMMDAIADNLVRGEFDPIIFSRVYSDLTKKYGENYVLERIGSPSRKKLNKLISEIERDLPQEARKRLAEAKEKIKTLDDLAKVLYEILGEDLSTYSYGFVIIRDFKNQRSVVIYADEEVYNFFEKLSEEARTNNININDLIKERWINQKEK